MTQNMLALQKANRVRLRRAELKRMLERGEVSIEDVITDWGTEKACVFEVLQWQWRWGKGRALRFIRALPTLTGVRITEKTTCAGMTERQREAVMEALTGVPRENRVVSGFYS